MTADLSFERARDVLDEFLIRPGGLWEMTAEFVDVDDDFGPRLEMTRYLYDSRDERYWDEYPPEVAALPLTFTRYVEPRNLADEEEWVRFICESIAMFAAHEALEWVRRNGEMVWDPHVKGEPLVRLV